MKEPGAATDQGAAIKQTFPREGRGGWPAWDLPQRHRRDGKITPQMLASTSSVASHALSPDGETVAFVWYRDEASDIWTMPIAGDQGSHVEGWPARLTCGRPLVSPNLMRWREDFGAPCWSPNGHWIVYGTEVPLTECGDGDIWAVPAEGGSPLRISDGTGSASQPRVSPDGKQVVYVTCREDHCLLAIAALPGGFPVVLDTGARDVSDPQWSPDGMTLAFSSHPRKDLHAREIWLVPATGGPAAPLSRQAGATARCPRWSPDGAWIAFVSNQTGHYELWKVAADGGEAMPLTALNQDVSDIQWSPDGSTIAFVANHEGSHNLFVVRADGDETRRLTDREGIHMRPQWTPDGKRLLFGFQSPSQPHDLFVMSAEGGDPRQITDSHLLAFREAGLVMPERVSYQSYDELEIPSFLFVPAAAQKGKECPALVFPHEGPVAHYGMEWHPELQFFVSKGYVVLCPNFRGSTGYGKTFEDLQHQDWGQGDLQDVLFAADYLKSLPFVDGDRLAVWGSSYGGYLGPLAIIKDQDRFRCAVALYGDCNLITSWAEGDYGGSLDLDRQMGSPAVHRADYEAGSPINYVSGMKAPLLVLHGMDDACVSILQSMELIEALQREGKRFEYAFYPGEGHGFQKRAHIIDVYRRTERFLDWYLL